MAPRKYIKRPVPVEAEAWNGKAGKESNIPAVKANASENHGKAFETSEGPILVPAKQGVIETLTGPALIEMGDYVLSQKGGVTVVKADEFRETYEPYTEQEKK